MAVLRYDSPFCNVKDHVVRAWRGREFVTAAQQYELRVTLDQMLEILYRRPLLACLAEAVWRQALIAAQRGTELDESLLPVYLALPALQRSVRRAVRWRKDRVEIEAEALSALVAAQSCVNPEASDAGHAYVAAARRQMWRALRLAATRERPVADIAAHAAAYNVAPCFSAAEKAEDRWELRFEPLVRRESLSATLRFTVDGRRVEGVRLGALAQRIGLQEVVYRARRHSEEESFGRLSLAAAQARR